MTTENTVTGDANPDLASSGDTDAQLAAMQAEEKEQPSEEQPKEVESEPEAKVKEEKVVPLAALHEERSQRKELQRQLAEQRQLIEKANQRLEALFNPPKQAPNPQEDAVGYLDHRLGQLSEQNKQILEKEQQRESERAQQAVVTQLAQRVQLATEEFSKTAPDVREAGSYLNDIRARELMVLGMPEPQARAKAIDELNVALMGWAHEGQNPAQVAYELAKVRGYQPKQAQSAEQKIAAQQKGTAAARSLGGGGAVSAGKLTAEALANMSDEEFSKLTESQFRQAMGG